MAKKKKTTKKAPQGVKGLEIKPRSDGISKSLAKGYEWWDDGGNDGLKQRPIAEGD